MRVSRMKTSENLLIIAESAIIAVNIGWLKEVVTSGHETVKRAEPDRRKKSTQMRFLEYLRKLLSSAPVCA